MSIRVQVNWSEHQDGIMMGATGPQFGYCCGCCCYIVPSTVTITLAGLAGGLATYNGAHTASWIGHEVSYNEDGEQIGNACRWYLDLGSGAFVQLSRVWNALNATACSDTGDHLWWIEFGDPGNPQCTTYASKATTDGSDWAGSYTHYTLAGECADGTAMTATVGA